MPNAMPSRRKTAEPMPLKLMLQRSGAVEPSVKLAFVRFQTLLRCNIAGDLSAISILERALQQPHGECSQGRAIIDIGKDATTWVAT